MVDNPSPQFFDISTVYRPADRHPNSKPGWPDLYWDEPIDEEFEITKLRWIVQNPIILNEEYELIESFLSKD